MWVVTPPNAMPTVSSSGPRVYISDSVRMLMKWARWACGSMPPGTTRSPLASMTSCASTGDASGSDKRRRSCPSLTPMSQLPIGVGSDDQAAADQQIEHRVDSRRVLRRRHRLRRWLGRGRRALYGWRRRGGREGQPGVRQRNALAAIGDRDVHPLWARQLDLAHDGQVRSGGRRVSLLVEVAHIRTRVHVEPTIAAGRQEISRDRHRRAGVP